MTDVRSVMIREATPADAHVLALLNREVQQLHVDAHPHVFKQPTDDLSAVEAWISAREGTFFIAELDGLPMGYAYVELIDRPENPFTFSWRFMVIDQIAVSPMYQGQGVGRALVARCVTFASVHGAKQVILNTWDFNHQAQAFFRRCGFETVRYQMQLMIE